MHHLLEGLKQKIALPDDDDRELTRKATFIIFGMLMSVGGVVWSAMCFAFGLWQTAFIPLAYTVIVSIGVIIFIITRRYYVISRIQLFLSLVLPFTLQWSLGGFKKSGVMMCWAIIAPLAAQFFGGQRLSPLWISGFLILTVASGFIDPYVSQISGLPESVHVAAFVINFAMVSLFVAFASQYFYAQMAKNQQKLTDSLSEISALNDQQDADYYLTSLLVSPLFINNIRGPNVAVEFFIRQKKQFRMHKTEGEIGGDFCAAEFITLQGRRYAALINADAMGKSIQGAGGALIIGTIIHLLIERTRIMDNYRSMLPERWLKNAYTEVKAAFQTLDGRMQISFIFALYDEHTGALYQINAEHPTAIRVHDGHPDFLPTKQVGAKLGSGREADFLQIEVSGLDVGDSFYLGSDGKDDLLMEDGTHEQIFNQDEHLFLRNIRESKGDLNEIYLNSKRSGEIIDDYSIAKLHVLAIPAREHINQYVLGQELLMLGSRTNQDTIDAIYFRKQLKRLLAERDYAHAFALAEVAVREYPLDESFVLAASHAARKLSLHDRAIDYGEALILRGSTMAQVYLNLSRSYLAIGQAKRSRHYYDLLPDSLKWHKSTHTLRASFYGDVFASRQHDTEAPLTAGHRPAKTTD